MHFNLNLTLISRTILFKKCSKTRIVVVYDIYLSDSHHNICKNLNTNDPWKELYVGHSLRHKY